MAVKNLNISSSALDFGTVRADQTSDVTITFTNSSSPPASVNVVVEIPSAPFSIVAGTDSFTLATDTDTASITFRFTPVRTLLTQTGNSYGTFTQSLVVTATVGWNVFTSPLVLTGIGWSWKYDLPVINNMAVGVIKAQLIMPIGDAHLTGIPIKNFFVDIGAIEETVQSELNQAPTSTAVVKIVDDYTDYTEGFWWKVSASAFQLRFVLVEDGTDTFLFYGEVQPQQTKWTEHYVGSLGYVREGEFSLLSGEGVLFSVHSVDWVTEVLSRSTVFPFDDIGGGVSSHACRSVISLLDLFECMLTVSGLNSWVTTGGYDITTILDPVDIKYFVGATPYDFSSIYVPTTHWYFGGGAGAWVYGIYWDNSDPNGFASRFSTLQEIISVLLFNYQLTMRFSYDLATERHKIQLIQLGRAYSTDESPEFSPTESQIVMASNLIGDAVKVACAYSAYNITDTDHNGTKYVWVSRKYNISGTTEAYPPNSYVQFDIDKPLIHYSLTWSPVLTGYYFSYSSDIFIVAAGVFYQISDVQVWRYDTGAYYNRGAVDIYTIMDAIAKYVFYKMPIINKMLMTRTYPTMKIGGSHINATIMRRTAVDLGSGSKNFYANKVTKHISTGDLSVEWIQE